MKAYLFLFLIIVIAVSCNNEKQTSLSESEPATTDEAKSQLEIDINIIKKHLNKKGIAAKETTSGLFYSIETQGTGNKVDKNKTVSFHTTGKLLDETKFYSSLDDGQPLEIIIGQKMVVPGMEEGLQLFNEGGKGTLFLPAELGYGQQGFGTQIPPNSILIFDVEVISVQ